MDKGQLKNQPLFLRRSGRKERKQRGENTPPSDQVKIVRYFLIRSTLYFISHIMTHMQLILVNILSVSNKSLSYKGRWDQLLLSYQGQEHYEKILIKELYREKESLFLQPCYFLYSQKVKLSKKEDSQSRSLQGRPRFGYSSYPQRGKSSKDFLQFIIFIIHVIWIHT